MAACDDNYLLVIAIDFGTTFSGYAFSFKASKEDIKMNKSWGAELGFQSYKTPTSVLLKPNGQLHSFGFQAETEFSNFDEDEIAEGYQIYQRFKMDLYSQEKLDSNTVITSSTGQETPALKVFAAALKFMKKHCFDAVAKNLTRVPDDQYIRWVITVPAIWTDTAKKFMRLAATDAGLVPSMVAPNLIIALEPEAASLYCRSLDVDKFIGMDGVNKPVTVKPGEKYMIVDCGGGTIDITVHELLDNGNVQEVEGASGGAWGGNYVDKKYYELLDKIFGKDFLNKMKCNYPSQWLNITTEFENKKRASTRDSKVGVSVNISMTFAKQFEKYSGKDFEEHIKAHKDLGVKFQNGMLRLSSDTINELYSDVIPQMKQHIRNLLTQSNAIQVNKIFVVGGFAESAHIQSFLRSEFGSSRMILIPEEAGMCIMKGAVLFGHNPASVSSRIARFNYGVRCYRTYNSLTDNPIRKVTLVDVPETKIHFILRLINRGETIKLNDIANHTLYPLTADQTIVEFGLYSTEDDDTDDPTHPTAHKLETISIQSPDVTKGNRRKFKVSLKFGGTDIAFKAIDEESGNEASTIVQL